MFLVCVMVNSCSTLLVNTNAYSCIQYMYVNLHMIRNFSIAGGIVVEYNVESRQVWKRKHNVIS